MEPRGGIKKSKKEQTAIGRLSISADAFTLPRCHGGGRAIGGHADIRYLVECALPFPRTIARSRYRRYGHFRRRCAPLKVMLRRVFHERPEE